MHGLSAQELEEFKPKDKSYKSRLLDKGSKKLYIASFGINLEMYKEAVDKKKATGFRNTITNSAKAKAAVGLGKLDKVAIQAAADQLYTEFIADMKSKGYEIISADEAGQTDYYKGWTKASGPSVFETDMPGIVGVIPTGHTFYYRERTVLTNSMAGLQKGSQYLSKDLDDALIADVYLAFPFSRLGADWNVAKQAKVKLLMDYRLASSFAVINEEISESVGSINSMIDKSAQMRYIGSGVTFTRGKLKIGGSPEAQYAGTMKSDLQITGVIEQEKVVAISKQTTATATRFNPIVEIKALNYSENTVWIEFDGQKYADGMYLAARKFINFHTNEALD